jgi:O-antigen/teichoic acid export membrane protein
MPGWFSRFPVSDFFKNVATVISGTTLAQIISLAIYLIITRIYTPDDLGVYALFMSIITITVIIASGKYELAVMLPRKDSDAMNLVALGAVISIITSLVLLVTAICFHHPIALLLGNEKIEFWLYFIPLATFLNGIYQSLNYWSNRYKRYRNITAANLGQSLVNSAAKLGLGAIVKGPLGLITGALAGQLAGFSIFGASFLRHDREKLKQVSASGIMNVAREYKMFPKYNMLHGIINNFSGSLPVFILTSYFSSAVAGLYSLGLTMLFRPLNLVGGAIKQVLSQQIIQKQNNGEMILPDLKKILKKLLQFSLIPFLVLGFFAPFIFKVVFGGDWEEAGRYTQLITIWLFLVLLCAPYSFLPDLFRRQRKAMMLEVVKMVVRAAALAAGVYYHNTYLAVLLFGISSALVSAYQLFWYFQLAVRADIQKQKSPGNE